MTTTNTTNENFTAGQLAALKAMGSPATMDKLLLLVDRESFRNHLKSLDINQKIGPMYTRRSENSVRFMYSMTLIHAGISEVHASLFDILPAGALNKTANVIFDKYAASRGNCPGRLLGLERAHDIKKFAMDIRSVASSLAETREARFDAKESRRYGGRHKPVERWHNAYIKPKYRIEELAECSIARWLPAIQNIISRLPEAERLAELITAQKELSSYLLILDKLHTMTKKSSDEYARWKSGYGAVDAAIMASAGILAYAVTLARRIVANSSPIGNRLRNSANEAWWMTQETLKTLAAQRMQLMTLQVWCEDKPGMVDFARATGGMAPDLEVLYHARGSNFTGH